MSTLFVVLSKKQPTQHSNLHSQVVRLAINTIVESLHADWVDIVVSLVETLAKLLDSLKKTLDWREPTTSLAFQPATKDKLTLKSRKS